MVALCGGGVQLGSNAGGDGIRRYKRVAPNAENLPPPEAKKAGYATVADAVVCDFALPVFAISLGHATVPAAAVPEAAIHKDRKALAGKDEVGAAWERLVPAPTGNAGGAEN
jgi:hypothetical protein